MSTIHSLTIMTDMMQNFADVNFLLWTTKGNRYAYLVEQSNFQFQIEFIEGEYGLFNFKITM